jgi:hypothetical protein
MDGEAGMTCLYRIKATVTKTIRHRKDIDHGDRGDTHENEPRLSADG